MNDNQLTVGIGLDTSALDKGISNAQSKLQSFGDRMQTIGQRLSVSLALPLGILATKIFKSTAEYERLELSLKAIEGSAEGAKKRIAELTEVAKLPGIGFEQAIKGDVRLRAVGIAAKTSKSILQEFANAIAFTGGTAEQLDLVTYQLSQMSAKSKVLGNDLRPIIEQAPAVASAIKEMFGTVDPEIISEKLANAGKNSTQFIEELVVKLKDIPRVQGGFSNALDNMGNALNRFFSEIGTQIVKDFDLTTKIDSLSGVLETLAQSFNGLDPSIRNAIVIIGALAIALPPLMFAIGGLTNAFIAVANPITLVATALIALGAVLVEDAIKTKEFNNVTKSLEQVNKDAERSIRSQTLSIEKNIDILRDSKSTTDEVKKAKKELIAINPDYEKALKGEIVDYSELNKVTSVTIGKLLKVAYYKKVIAQQDAAVKGLAELRAGGGLSAMDEFSIWAERNLSNKGIFSGDTQKKDNLAIDARKRIVIEKGQQYVDAINRTRIEIAKADKSILEEINKESATTPKGVGNIPTGKDSKAFDPTGALNTLKESLNGIGDNIDKIKAELIEKMILLRDAMKIQNRDEIIKHNQNSVKQIIEKSINNSLWTDTTNSIAENIKNRMNAIGQSIKDSAPKLNTAINELNAWSLYKAQEMSYAFADTLKSGISVALDGFGDLVQAALMKGDKKLNFKKVFANLLGTIGDLMIELGKKAVMINIAFESIKFPTGAAGVALGLGLIAAGGTLKAVSANMSRTSSQTGTSRVTSNITPTYMPSGYGMVEFEIKGTTLKGVLNNTERLNG